MDVISEAIDGLCKKIVEQRDRIKELEEGWQPIETKPPWTICEERGLYTHDGDKLFYFKATHWRPVRSSPKKFLAEKFIERY